MRYKFKTTTSQNLLVLAHALTIACCQIFAWMVQKYFSLLRTLLINRIYAGLLSLLPSLTLEQYIFLLKLIACRSNYVQHCSACLTYDFFANT